MKTTRNLMRERWGDTLCDFPLASLIVSSECCTMSCLCILGNKLQKLLSCTSSIVILHDFKWQWRWAHKFHFLKVLASLSSKISINFRTFLVGSQKTWLLTWFNYHVYSSRLKTTAVFQRIKHSIVIYKIKHSTSPYARNKCSVKKVKHYIPPLHFQFNNFSLFR